MPSKRNGFEFFLVRKLRAVDKRLAALSERLNYNGELIFQSKVFFICLSLFISVALWFFVALDSDSDASRTMNVDINYVNLPTGFSVYAPVKKVEIKVAGKINFIQPPQPLNLFF